MAKKNQSEEQKQAREALQERRRQLLENKHADKMRILRYSIYGVAGLIALIVIAGLVVEFFITPNQAVAEVGGEEITLQEWQDVVRYQRAQLIVAIEEQYDLFVGLGEETEDGEEAEEPDQETINQALRTIQQFSGQQIALLSTASDQLGEFVLEQMVNDQLIRQGAEERGLTVSEAEIDEAIGVTFNYYDGGLPTPFPTPTESPEPTPSLTPVGFSAPEEEDVAEDAAVEAVPTVTPLPTATPVSESSFNEQLDEELASLTSLGADISLYRELVRNDLFREKFSESLFVESGEPTVVPHVSYFALQFDTVELAQAEVDALAGGEAFVTRWNEVRTMNQDPVLAEALAAGQTAGATGVATESLWRTEAQLLDLYIEQAAVAEIMSLGVGDTSGIIQVVDTQSNLPLFLIVQVTGIEDRELSEFTINQREQELLETWITEQRAANSTIFDTWEGRAPRQPVLDEQFRNPAPTPEPQPTLSPIEPSSDGG